MKSVVGFTMIELLTAVSIMMLLLGGGIAAYMQFDEGQELRRATDEVISALELVRKEARAGDKPSSCQRMLTNTVNFNTHTYTTSTVCDNNGSIQNIETSRQQIDDSVTFQNAGMVSFRVLHGGVPYAPLEITLVHNNGESNTIEIGVAGTISVQE